MQDFPLEEELNKEEKKGASRHGFAKGFVSGMLICAAVCAVISGIVMYATTRGDAGSDILDADTKSKISAIAEAAKNKYYTEVDDDTLRAGMLKGMLQALDSYSTYYTAEEYSQFYDAAISGSYAGIGAQLQSSDSGEVVVVDVYSDSPAEEAGIKAGDILISANGNMAADMDLTTFASYVRGEEGTDVTLVIKRDGEEMTVSATRRELEYPYVEYEMIETGGKNIGYIGVAEFATSAEEQFRNALESLESEGADAIIVDLRGNPGGLLTSSCKMLDMILPEGLLVYTEDRNGEGEQIYSTDEEVLELPLAVIINKNSASASEIFAGAIKDRDAGTIVGTTSYGKGIVQSVIKFDDGSAYRLTTSSYYTPSGVSIQGVGVEPDIYVEYDYTGDEDGEYDPLLDTQIKAAVDALL